MVNTELDNFDNFDNLKLEDQLLRSRKLMEELGIEEDIKKFVEEINEVNSLTQEEKPFNWPKTLISAVLSFVLIYLTFGFDILFSIVFMLTFLIHELGHLIIQKRYGFNNVSLVFLGPLGAFVTGFSKNNSESENFWMYIMGPLPGLLISLSILLVFRIFPQDSSTQIVGYLILFAEISLIINAFNLFPGGFLDGARIFSVCFDKYPYGSWIFKILLSAILLIYLSFDLYESISYGEVSISIVIGVILAFLLIHFKSLLNRRIPEIKRISIKFSSFLIARYREIPKEMNYDMASYICYQLENTEYNGITIDDIWDARANPPGELQRKYYVFIYLSVIFLAAFMFYYFL